jgi:hypothetical protein
MYSHETADVGGQKRIFPQERQPKSVVFGFPRKPIEKGEKHVARQ